MPLNFQEIYEETKVDLQHVEAIRRKNLPVAILGSLIVLIAPTWLVAKMALILINETNEDIPEWLVIVVALITMIGIGVIRYFAFRSIQEIFRGSVIPKIVEKIGPEFSYSPMGQVDESLGQQSKLFPDYGLWKGKDHVRGTIDGNLIELSQVVLKTSSASTSDSGSDRSQSTLFKGVLIHMEVPTHFADPVWVIPKKRPSNYHFPALSKVATREVIKITGIHKGYYLHTTNGVVAKRLFSGNRLIEINQLIKNFRRKGITRKRLMFAFYDNHICIAFERKKGGIPVVLDAYLYKTGFSQIY